VRKIVFLSLGIASAILFYFTFVSVDKVFRPDWELPLATGQQQAKYRLVLITQELETPFWVQVGEGAAAEARKRGASIEIWGSYGKNQEDFLKKVEIAIDSKVDGIIVQGLDTADFKNLAKLKASFYGIPVITVANDVPMVDSLRRTYVGSDQYLAGRMIAGQLLEDMGTKGNVILMGDSRREYYQEQRLKGIRDVLETYRDVKIQYAETGEAREQVLATTRDQMNKLPDVNAFVAVNANIAGAMLQEIGRRSRVDQFHIYSFDDSHETESLLREGKIDGLIRQSPGEMGRQSVALMIQWLSGETVPLDTEGYLTDIRMEKAGKAR